MSTQDERLRPLKHFERIILEKLLETSFPGREELVQQLSGLHVRQIDDGGSLKLQPVMGNKISLARDVVSEARYPDFDTDGDAGPHVNVLLHVVDGRLSMLEIYKDDNSIILKKPNPEEFQLFSKFTP